MRLIAECPPTRATFPFFFYAGFVVPLLLAWSMPVASPFGLVFALAFFSLGAWGILRWLRNLFERQELLLDTDRLCGRSRLFGWRRERCYSRLGMSNLRVSDFSWFDECYYPFFLVPSRLASIQPTHGWGVIAFEDGSTTVRLGAGLSTAEADGVVARIRQEWAEG